MVTVRDLIKTKGTEVWSVSPDSTMIDALNLLAKKDVGALMVTKDGKMVGIVSERDFVRSIAKTGQCLLHSTVERYMTTDISSVSPDTTIDQCMQLMTDKHIRHLPVLENDKLIAVISIGDVVRDLISNKELTINQLEDYIQGRTFTS
ncbi:MAG: CBS domain-containing protein [Chloroflexi bacterium]|nr:CBS domain-containing protein [Chloroflexota bacterium]BCY17828.1 histidine kinase [Leptolinea sp. HRD-7]